MADAPDLSPEALERLETRLVSAALAEMDDLSRDLAAHQPALLFDAATTLRALAVERSERDTAVAQMAREAGLIDAAGEPVPIAEAAGRLQWREYRRLSARERDRCERDNACLRAMLGQSLRRCYTLADTEYRLRDEIARLRAQS